MERVEQEPDTTRVAGGATYGALSDLVRSREISCGERDLRRSRYRRVRGQVVGWDGLSCTSYSLGSRLRKEAYLRIWFAIKGLYPKPIWGPKGVLWA